MNNEEKKRLKDTLNRAFGWWASEDNNFSKAHEEDMYTILSLIDRMPEPKTEDKYMELIMAVENKYPGESRHQTALRYIKEAESRSSHTCKALGIKATP
uniref:Uncharacterized protein n=1 Tax=viral metagenome TaxID=1070528 RepID=A0A6H1ZG30_9ZZZZ